MTQPTADYHSLAGFEHVYLEDSYVLGITAQPGTLTITLDLVLTADHPAYQPPTDGEQHHLQPAEITFVQVTSLTWTEQGAPPATDASGQIDYGGIDTLLRNGTATTVEGDFGRLHVESPAPALRLRS
jgi:hypothetical protein